MAYYAASIDDNDPGFIYSDGWVLVTQDGDWTGTMHSTSVPGSYARVRFTGSRVAAVFTIPTGDGNSIAATFSLDNGPAVTRSRATTGPVQWNYLLFDSGPLPYGNHLLVITDVAKSGYLRIDRIDYDPTPNSAPSSSAPPVVIKTTTTPVQAPPTTVVVTSPASAANNNTPPASVAPSSDPSTTGPNTRPATPSSVTPPSNTNTNSLPSSTPLNTVPSAPASQPAATPSSPIDANAAQSTPSGTQSKSSGPSAGLIGGVLGTVVVVLLILLTGIFIARRRRKRARSGTHSTVGAAPNAPTNTVPTPFDISMHDRSDTQLVSRWHFGSPSASGTDFSAPTSDMYTSGQPSTSISASLSTNRRDVAFDSTMMASAKYVEHLQETETSTTSPGTHSAYATHGTNTQQLSSFTEYVPPPAYQ